MTFSSIFHHWIVCSLIFSRIFCIYILILTITEFSWIFLGCFLIFFAELFWIFCDMFLGFVSFFSSRNFHGVFPGLTIGISFLRVIHPNWCNIGPAAVISARPNVIRPIHKSELFVHVVPAIPIFMMSHKVVTRMCIRVRSPAGGGGSSSTRKTLPRTSVETSSIHPTEWTLSRPWNESPPKKWRPFHRKKGSLKKHQMECESIYIIKIF